MKDAVDLWRPLRTPIFRHSLVCRRPARSCRALGGVADGADRRPGAVGRADQTASTLPRIRRTYRGQIDLGGFEDRHLPADPLARQICASCLSSSSLRHDCMPNMRKRLEVCLEEGVPVVSFFWGDPSPFLGRVHEGGAVAMLTVGSADQARTAVDQGVDILVAQGWEVQSMNR